MTTTSQLHLGCSFHLIILEYLINVLIFSRLFFKHLHNFNDIQQAVDDLTKDTPDTVPMAEMFGLMAKELRSLSLAQKITKRENALLLAASRKAKVDEVVSRLTNPMSVRAVKLNFRVLHLLEDIMSVLKPNGVVYMHTDLVQVGKRFPLGVELTPFLGRRGDCLRGA